MDDLFCRLMAPALLDEELLKATETRQSSTVPSPTPDSASESNSSAGSSSTSLLTHIVSSDKDALDFLLHMLTVCESPKGRDNGLYCSSTWPETKRLQHQQHQQQPQQLHLPPHNAPLEPWFPKRAEDPSFYSKLAQRLVELFTTAPAIETDAFCAFLNINALTAASMDSCDSSRKHNHIEPPRTRGENCENGAAKQAPGSSAHKRLLDDSHGPSNIGRTDLQLLGQAKRNRIDLPSSTQQVDSNALQQLLMSPLPCVPFAEPHRENASLCELFSSANRGLQHQQPHQSHYRNHKSTIANKMNQRVNHQHLMQPQCTSLPPSLSPSREAPRVTAGSRALTAYVQPKRSSTRPESKTQKRRAPAGKSTQQRPMTKRISATQKHLWALEAQTYPKVKHLTYNQELASWYVSVKSASVGGDSSTRLWKGFSCIRFGMQEARRLAEERHALLHLLLGIVPISGPCIKQVLETGQVPPGILSSLQERGVTPESLGINVAVPPCRIGSIKGESAQEKDTQGTVTKHWLLCKDSMQQVYRQPIVGLVDP